MRSDLYLKQEQVDNSRRHFRSSTPTKHLNSSTVGMYILSDEKKNLLLCVISFMYTDSSDWANNFWVFPNFEPSKKETPPAPSKKLVKSWNYNSISRIIYWPSPFLKEVYFFLIRLHIRWNTIVYTMLSSSRRMQLKKKKLHRSALSIDHLGHNT